MEPQLNQPSAANAADKTVKGPKSLFWYLTMFFMLAISAFNVGALWFQYINKWFPQEVSGGMVQRPFNQSALKFSLASILVAVPLFFLLSRLIRKTLKNGNLNSQNKIRVWVTYIILFLTIAIAVGDLITTIFRVLDGDYTLRFLLKALTILFIVSWIFAYFWLELRSPASLTDSKIPRSMASATILIIVVSFVGAFFVVDSPAVARAKAYDRTRIFNLQEIDGGIHNYFREFEKLPLSLDDLKSSNIYLKTTDPKTEKPYEYKVVAETSYEICAEFQTSNKAAQDLDFYGPVYGEFAHDSGRNCFTRKVNLELIDKGLLRIPQ